MIEKLAGALGRRGVIRGALGLGAAVRLGGGLAQKGATARDDFALANRGLALGGPYVGTQQAAINPTPLPDWIKALEEEAEGLHERERARERMKVDGLDIDIAMLRGPSPAWKLATQRARDTARVEAAKSLWQRLSDAKGEWYRSLTR